MFSNEFDHDEISITILDEQGNHEDVKYLIYDNLVYIRQWDEERNMYQVITMSPSMFDDFFAAMVKPEGLYYQIDKKREGN